MNAFTNSFQERRLIGISTLSNNQIWMDEYWRIIVGFLFFYGVFPFWITLLFTPLCFSPISNSITGGRCLGGSSVTNGLFYSRGTASVYDRWVDLGNPGWGWDDVYPLFIKGGYALTNGVNSTIANSYCRALTSTHQDQIQGLIKATRPGIPKRILTDLSKLGSRASCLKLLWVSFALAKQRIFLSSTN